MDGGVADQPETDQTRRKRQEAQTLRLFGRELLAQPKATSQAK
jgi:hypothetical protein